jgi:hypothetical protein
VKYPELVISVIREVRVIAYSRGNAIKKKQAVVREKRKQETRKQEARRRRDDYVHDLPFDDCGPRAAVERVDKQRGRCQPSTAAQLLPHLEEPLKTIFQRQSISGIETFQLKEHRSDIGQPFLQTNREHYDRSQAGVSHKVQAHPRTARGAGQYCSHQLGSRFGTDTLDPDRRIHFQTIIQTKECWSSQCQTQIRISISPQENICATQL